MAVAFAGQRYGYDVTDTVQYAETNISVPTELCIEMFWVISVYFDLRNTLPMLGPFLLGHPVYICKFDKDILPRHTELKHHPIVQHAPLNTRDVLHGGRTEAIVLHYATREGETLQYYDVMSLYPHVCKYSKLPVGHHTIKVGDACRDKQAMLSKEGLIKCSVLRDSTIQSCPTANFCFVYVGRAQSNAIFPLNVHIIRQRKDLYRQYGSMKKPG